MAVSFPYSPLQKMGWMFTLILVSLAEKCLAVILAVIHLAVIYQAVIHLAPELCTWQLY